MRLANLRSGNDMQMTLSQSGTMSMAFLQHLNSQQPTIRFTMEIEKDNTIPFLDTTVTRETDGLLTTTFYRKPTNTDQYLTYDVHHPQSVKRGFVKCLQDRAKHLTTKPSGISEEKKNLSSVLVSNDYPSSFVRKLAKTTSVTANKEPAKEFKSTAVLPYIKGVSEVLRRCLQKQGIRTVLQSKRRDLLSYRDPFIQFDFLTTSRNIITLVL